MLKIGWQAAGVARREVTTSSYGPYGKFGAEFERFEGSRAANWLSERVIAGQFRLAGAGSGGVNVREETTFSLKAILALTLVHLSGDLYNSFIYPLLPLLVDKFSLTLAKAGLITGVMQLMTFVVQPSVGYLADRYRTRLFILAGPLLAIIFMPLVGAASSFWLVLCFVALGAIGTATFHPPAAGMVTSFAGPRAGFGMSFFGLGGTIGYAVGPLVAVFWVSRHGLEALPFTAVFGLSIMAFLIFIVPRPVGEGLKGVGFVGAIREAIGGAWRGIALIWIIAVLNDFVILANETFIPIRLARLGYPLIAIGLFATVFSGGGALGALLAGHLSDKIGYKSIYYASFSLATPALLLLLFLPGWWVFVGAFVSGFIVMSTFFIAIVMAQKLAPGGRSMVASLMMGLAYGTAGMLNPLAGRLADHLSIQTVLTGVALLPLLALVLARRLPQVEGR